MHTETVIYDVVRAIVAAFAWRDGELLVPVSTQAVKHELHRRCREESATDILSHLSEVRDLQRLDGGFWLPAPTHLVSCDQFFLVVSGLSTHELVQLARVDSDQFGVSRTISADNVQASTLPVTSISEWMDAPTSTSEWTEWVFRSAQFGAPLAVDNFEVFRHWRANAKGRWLKFGDAQGMRDGIFLARHQSLRYRSNYYLLRIRKSGVEAMHELPPGFDIPRLMCGLRSKHGDPLVCRIWEEADAMLVLHAGVVPASERRLLRAIGAFREVEDRFVSEALIPRFALKCVTGVFESLGYTVERRVDERCPI